jgi:glycosyltransferase involved in cell wall biosynthesis
MTRVGFVFAAINDGWLGGINYFRNLLSAIQQLPERKIEPVVFTGLGTNGELFSSFPPVEIVRTNILDRYAPAWFLRKVGQKIMLHDILLEKTLARHGIAVMSHSSWLGKAARIPAIGWIPDFQHLHLPGFFSGREIGLRNREFQFLCRYSQCVLLSSFDAQKDLRTLWPECADQSEVLQFVADVNLSQTLPSMEELQKRYSFEGQYFHVPNQFWAHKNHRVVIDALRILNESGRKVQVLATGNTHDHRQPEFFYKLMDYAKECGIAENFRTLGIVPINDLFALMRNSIAMINPSLFEGWSTTVEEAKSLGKRIILSDIPVHREQAPAGGEFFIPENAQGLAEVMWRLWISHDSVTDERLVVQAREALLQRRIAFAEKYQDIVLHVVERGIAGC